MSVYFDEVNRVKLLIYFSKFSSFFKSVWIKCVGV